MNNNQPTKLTSLETRRHCD